MSDNPGNRSGSRSPGDATKYPRAPAGSDPAAAVRSETDGKRAGHDGEWIASERDQTASESDQTASDSDQTSAERDEERSEADQVTSDRDQAVADRERSIQPTAGSDSAYELSRAERQAGTRARGVSSGEREATAAARLQDATRRDTGARARDRSADDRDRSASERDRAAEQLERSLGLEPDSAAETRGRAAQIRARAAADRERAAADRERAAADRARAAEEREAARAEMLSAEAHGRESIGALVGGIAQNFNNLLTIVLLSAEHLLPVAGVPARADLEQIINAADRGAEITSQLLAFAGFGNEAPSPFSPGSAIRELEPTLASLMGHGVKLHIALHPDDPQVLLDVKEFNHLVVNLVLNARDAMPDGGTVKISSASRELTAHQAADLGRDPGRYVDVSVADTGIGISPELRGRIFDPFYTTKQGENTGLGLATVRRVVDGAGGWIDVRSNPAAGTTFQITLPELAAMPAA